MNIQEIIESGFKYRDLTLKEHIKNYFVFCEDESKPKNTRERYHIFPDTFIIDSHKEYLEKLEETEKFKSGDTDIKKYFEKYGTQMVPFKKPEYTSMIDSVTIWYDGKADPKYHWNSEIFKKYIGLSFSESTFSRVAGGYDELQVRTSMSSDHVDAQLKNGIPTIRHSHHWYDDMHLENVLHYTHEEFIEKLEHFKKLYLAKLALMIEPFSRFEIGKDWETILIENHSSHYLFFKGASFYKMTRIDKTRGRDLDGKMKRFPKTEYTQISQQDIIEHASKEFDKELALVNIDLPFKF